MKHQFIFSLFLTLQLLFNISVKAQSTKDLAIQKKEEAIQLEDSGDYIKAFKLLTEAKKLYPGNIIILYELSCWYYDQKQYKNAITTLDSLKKDDDCFDKVYQLLGNSYDRLKNKKVAEAIYNEGLKRYPESGCLNLENGIMLNNEGDVEAIQYFEKGIEVEPNFPSNYYWASKFFCRSDEALWGMFYGEIFINLEPHSKRTVEISKLLFETYKSQLLFNSSGNITMSFSTRVVNPIKEFNKSSLATVYEPAFKYAVKDENEINLNTLNKIKQLFLEYYSTRGLDRSYPNVLLDYQVQIEKSGNIEAYNYSVFKNADVITFNNWLSNNPKKWELFTKWIASNPLKIDYRKKFNRSQF